VHSSKSQHSKVLGSSWKVTIGILALGVYSNLRDLIFFYSIGNIYIMNKLVSTI